MDVEKERWIERVSYAERTLFRQVKMDRLQFLFAAILLGDNKRDFVLRCLGLFTHVHMCEEE